MDSAVKRRRKILEIIETYVIESQDKLKEYLAREDIRISQPTLSRDIKALKLTKIATPDGGYRYGRPELVAETLDLAGICATFVKSFAHSGNLVVLKTEPGTATVVGRSLDDAGWEEIIGTLAGTDTVLIVVNDQHLPRNLILKIKMLGHEKGFSSDREGTQTP
jgi:transcriptional regulator of arginine metabolism